MQAASRVVRSLAGKRIFRAELVAIGVCLVGGVTWTAWAPAAWRWLGGWTHPLEWSAALVALLVMLLLSRPEVWAGARPSPSPTSVPMWLGQAWAAMRDGLDSLICITGLRAGADCMADRYAQQLVHSERTSETWIAWYERVRLCRGAFRGAWPPNERFTHTVEQALMPVAAELDATLSLLAVARLRLMTLPIEVEQQHDVQAEPFLLGPHEQEALQTLSERLATANRFRQMLAGHVAPGSLVESRLPPLLAPLVDASSIGASNRRRARRELERVRLDILTAQNELRGLRQVLEWRRAQQRGREGREAYDAALLRAVETQAALTEHDKTRTDATSRLALLWKLGSLDTTELARQAIWIWYDSGSRDALASAASRVSDVSAGIGTSNGDDADAGRVLALRLWLEMLQIQDRRLAETPDAQIATIAMRAETWDLMLDLRDVRRLDPETHIWHEPERADLCWLLARSGLALLEDACHLDTVQHVVDRWRRGLDLLSVAGLASLALSIRPPLNKGDEDGVSWADALVLDQRVRQQMHQSLPERAPRPPLWPRTERDGFATLAAGWAALAMLLAILLAGAVGVLTGFHPPAATRMRDLHADSNLTVLVGAAAVGDDLVAAGANGLARWPAIGEAVGPVERWLPSDTPPGVPALRARSIAAGPAPQGVAGPWLYLAVEGGLTGVNAYLPNRANAWFPLIAPGPTDPRLATAVADVSQRRPVIVGPPGPDRGRYFAVGGTAGLHIHDNRFQRWVRITRDTPCIPTAGPTANRQLETCRLWSDDVRDIAQWGPLLLLATGSGIEAAEVISEVDGLRVSMVSDRYGLHGRTTRAAQAADPDVAEEIDQVAAGPNMLWARTRRGGLLAASTGNADSTARWEPIIGEWGTPELTTPQAPGADVVEGATLWDAATQSVWIGLPGGGIKRYRPASVTAEDSSAAESLPARAKIEPRSWRGYRFPTARAQGEAAQPIVRDIVRWGQTLLAATTGGLYRYDAVTDGWMQEGNAPADPRRLSLATSGDAVLLLTGTGSLWSREAGATAWVTVLGGDQSVTAPFDISDILAAAPVGDATWLLARRGSPARSLPASVQIADGRLVDQALNLPVGISFNRLDDTGQGPLIIPNPAMPSGQLQAYRLINEAWVPVCPQDVQVQDAAVQIGIDACQVSGGAAPIAVQARDASGNVQARRDLFRPLPGGPNLTAHSASVGRGADELLVALGDGGVGRYVASLRSWFRHAVTVPASPGRPSQPAQQRTANTVAPLGNDRILIGTAGAGLVELRPGAGDDGQIACLISEPPERTATAAEAKLVSMARGDGIPTPSGQFPLWLVDDRPLTTPSDSNLTLYDPISRESASLPVPAGGRLMAVHRAGAAPNQLAGAWPEPGSCPTARDRPTVNSVTMWGIVEQPGGGLGLHRYNPGSATWIAVSGLPGLNRQIVVSDTGQAAVLTEAPDRAVYVVETNGTPRAPYFVGDHDFGTAEAGARDSTGLLWTVIRQADAGMTVSVYDPGRHAVSRQPLTALGQPAWMVLLGPTGRQGESAAPRIMTDRGIWQLATAAQGITATPLAAWPVPQQGAGDWLGYADRPDGGWTSAREVATGKVWIGQRLADQSGGRWCDPPRRLSDLIQAGEDRVRSAELATIAAAATATASPIPEGEPVPPMATPQPHPARPSDDEIEAVAGSGGQLVVFAGGQQWVYAVSAQNCLTELRPVGPTPAAENARNVARNTVLPRRPAQIDLPIGLDTRSQNVRISWVDRGGRTEAAVQPALVEGRFPFDIPNRLAWNGQTLLVGVPGGIWEIPADGTGPVGAWRTGALPVVTATPLPASAASP